MSPGILPHVKRISSTAHQSRDTCVVSYVQLQFAMSEIASFDGLPLLIPSQSLVSLAANRQNSESANGRDLLVSFINDKYKARPDWCRMLTQSLRLNAVVIIFDGVDEAPQLKEGIQRLFTEDLVPKRVRFLLTSRPDGIDQLRFEHSFVILDLNPVRHQSACMPEHTQ